jgi:hypothetical protein
VSRVARPNPGGLSLTALLLSLACRVKRYHVGPEPYLDRRGDLGLRCSRCRAEW